MPLIYSFMLFAALAHYPDATMSGPKLMLRAEVVDGARCGTPLIRMALENWGSAIVVLPELGVARTARPKIYLETTIRTALGEIVSKQSSEDHERAATAGEFKLLRHFELIGSLINFEGAPWGGHALPPGRYTLNCRAHVRTATDLNQHADLKRAVVALFEWLQATQRAPIIVDADSNEITIAFEVRACP